MPTAVPSPDDLSADVRPLILRLATAIAEAGGRAWLVGGCVRDLLRGIRAKDIDLEVYGLPADRLEQLLAAHGKVITVGRSFGVFKLKGVDVDISLPRTERKEGTGHKGFAVTGDPHLDTRTATARRDFTLNAMLWDPLTGELEDPHGGRDDLAAGILRHTSAAFAEDPLRVLRGMQFVARFDLTPAPETVDLCARMTPEGLPPERLFGEWSKLFLRGRTPSRGLRFLRACGWVRYYPELAALIDCPQDPIWHPEGDVWTHTLACLDTFAAHRTGDEREDLIVGLAVLCHDLGKPATTATNEAGRIVARGHDQAGLEPTRTFLERLTAERRLIEAVLPLVEAHMLPAQLYKSGASDAAVRRLAVRAGRLDRLLRVVAADLGGRPGRDDDPVLLAWWHERMEALRVADAAPTPLVGGRDLIALGAKPGPHFKAYLEACYEAQLAGELTDIAGARAYLADLWQRRVFGSADAGVKQ